MEIKCSICGAVIKPGNTNGLPNGVGFVLDNGKTVNFCSKCLMEAPDNEDITEKLKKLAED